MARELAHRKFTAHRFDSEIKRSTERVIRYGSNRTTNALRHFRSLSWWKRDLQIQTRCS